MTDWHFKGGRTYIQGPTFFDYIFEKYISGVYQPRNIDFSSSKLTGMKCRVIPFRKDSVPADKIVGQYLDDRNHFSIIETEEPVTERVPYEEKEITRLCLLKENEIAIPVEIPGYSFMEIVVAAFKFLLISLHGEKFGKYVFARIQLVRIPDGTFRIAFDRIISNRYFQGTIRQNSEVIGMVFFGVRR